MSLVEGITHAHELRQNIKQAVAGLRTNALCFDAVLPAGRVTLNIRRFGVLLPNCSVHVLNGAGTALYTDTPLNASGGTVSFTPPATTLQNMTPPSSPTFSLAITIGGVQSWTNPILVPSAPTTLTFDSTLISPNHQANYTASSTLSVPFRWHTLSGGTNYRLWLRHNTGSWVPYNLGNVAGVDLTNPMPGLWQWDVEVFNVGGQMIGQSEMRTFTVSQPSPSPSPMGGLFDDPWYDEVDEFADSGELSVVRDMNKNVLSPVRGLVRTQERMEPDADMIGIRSVIVLDENGQVPSLERNLLLQEGYEFVDIEALELTYLDSRVPADTSELDLEDDWLFMTPEGQYLLYLEYLFGGSDSVSP